MGKLNDDIDQINNNIDARNILRKSEELRDQKTDNAVSVASLASSLIKDATAATLKSSYDIKQLEFNIDDQLKKMPAILTTAISKVAVQDYKDELQAEIDLLLTLGYS